MPAQMLGQPRRDRWTDERRQHPGSRDIGEHLRTLPTTEGDCDTDVDCDVHRPAAQALYETAGDELCHVSSRTGNHQTDQEDHQADQQRFGWADPIAEAPTDHGGEEHPDHER